MSAVCKLTMGDVSERGSPQIGFCGSTSGNLYIFRFKALLIDRNQVVNFNLQKIRKTDMALTRGFSAHTSMVLCCSLITCKDANEKYFFSTSVSDQCIMQWKIAEEDHEWELDYNKFSEGREDPFLETPTPDRFSELTKEIWPQRLEVAEFRHNID